MTKPPNVPERKAEPDDFWAPEPRLDCVGCLATNCRGCDQEEDDECSS
jgi:hypothetical protein